MTPSCKHSIIATTRHSNVPLHMVGLFQFIHSPPGSHSNDHTPSLKRPSQPTKTSCQKQTQINTQIHQSWSVRVVKGPSHVEAKLNSHFSSWAEVIAVLCLLDTLVCRCLANHCISLVPLARCADGHARPVPRIIQVTIRSLWVMWLYNTKAGDSSGRCDLYYVSHCPAVTMPMDQGYTDFC